MYIQYEEFQEKLNKRLFEGSRKDLLEKLSKNPDRFTGFFRPSKLKTKLIQSIMQSHEIRFGDALEEIFTIYFERAGFNQLPKEIITPLGQKLNVDQLFEKNDIVYLIEQKVCDDHDISQFNNFEDKYHEVSNLYTNSTVKPIMWFIDASLVKNKNYYLVEMETMQEAYSCEPKLCYGDELFDNAIISSLNHDIWDEILENLMRWKNSLPDMPELNFDNESFDVFDEIKELPPSVYRKLFEHEEIKLHILSIIFPSGETLNMLKEYFNTFDKQIYKTLINYIDDFLR